VQKCHVFDCSATAPVTELGAALTETAAPGPVGRSVGRRVSPRLYCTDWRCIDSPKRWWRMPVLLLPAAPAGRPGQRRACYIDHVLRTAPVHSSADSPHARPPSAWWDTGSWRRVRRCSISIAAVFTCPSSPPAIIPSAVSAAAAVCAWAVKLSPSLSSRPPTIYYTKCQWRLVYF